MLCALVLTAGYVTISGDIDLATSKEVIIAWMGDGSPPAGHLLVEHHDVNSIVCCPQDEDTMVSVQATAWLGFLVGGAKHVADIYSKCGK